MIPPETKLCEIMKSATKTLPPSDQSWVEGKQIEVSMCSFAAEQFCKQAVGYFIFICCYYKREAAEKTLLHLEGTGTRLVPSEGGTNPIGFSEHTDESRRSSVD